MIRELMSGILFLISLMLLATLSARKVAGKRHGFRLGTIISLAGVTFLLALLLINDAFPFTDGGDDLDYFYASSQSFSSLGDWFDTARYASSHEQAGYPLLLAWVDHFSGDSLYYRKALNVFFMLEIVVVWFSIGNAVGGSRLAFIYAWGMIFATPLWFYWFFLLKDLAIVLLQSIFVLGLIRFISSERGFRGYGLIALSTIAVIPFRSMLAVLNILLFVACMFVRRRSVTSSASFAARLVVAASLVLGLWAFVSQPGAMGTLGVTGGDRALSMEGILAQLERAERDRQSVGYDPLLFPVLYLVGETNALNPNNWAWVEAEQLRPLSMVPWILAGLPFFLAGAGMMLRRTRAWQRFASLVRHHGRHANSENFTARQTDSLLVLLAFILAYAVLGWLNGTTVRWTLPAIPAMISIAGFAWANMSKRMRIRLLTSFDLSFLTLAVGYYLVLK